ncbi:MAG: hypothetical protein R2856_08220 [Caldilineaceae bacterium]
MALTPAFHKIQARSKLRCSSESSPTSPYDGIQKTLRPDVVVKWFTSGDGPYGVGNRSLPKLMRPAQVHSVADHLGYAVTPNWATGKRDEVGL